MWVGVSTSGTKMPWARPTSGRSAFRPGGELGGVATGNSRDAGPGKRPWRGRGREALGLLHR